MSAVERMIRRMDEGDLISRAHALGMDHAEKDHNGRLHHRLYAGKEVARALGVSDSLEGDQYVALRESYEGGWSAFA